MSSRFCIFPQQLVVRFTVGECRLKKIQILSHHFKISTRLELYVGCKRISSASSEKSRYSNSSKQDVTQDGIRYVRLGFVSLGDNSNSGYKARELKSIPVDEEGEYLKIIFHQNYINSLNLYNQVGLVALTVVGEYDQTQIFSQGVGQQTKTIIGLDPLAPDHAPAAAEDSTADEFQVSSYQDQYLVKIMKSAIQAKKDAVRDENFKLANALKTLVELTRKASEEVSKLLLLKAKSIELEDYELAEDAKDDIDQIKDALASKINELGLKRTQDDRIIPLEQIEPVISKVPTHPPIQTPDTTMDLPKAALMERMRADSMEAARRREEEELIQQRKALEEEERKRESAALQQTELIEAVPETRLTDALPAISEPRPKRTETRTSRACGFDSNTSQLIRI
ncbi:hypothetical protein BDR26DRAFT_10129 [Obelidium mucronatum]|nr:hypothetical protein BDR26DRAFT_10129 [Obelidium mucronatum]